MKLWEEVQLLYHSEVNYFPIITRAWHHDVGKGFLRCSGLRAGPPCIGLACWKHFIGARPDCNLGSLEAGLVAVGSLPDKPHVWWLWCTEYSESFLSWPALTHFTILIMYIHFCGIRPDSLVFAKGRHKWAWLVYNKGTAWCKLHKVVCTIL